MIYQFTERKNLIMITVLEIENREFDGKKWEGRG
jgi:hypothetical protein